MAKRQRRSFNPEFKAEAVRLCKVRGALVAVAVIGPRRHKQFATSLLSLDLKLSEAELEWPDGS